MVKPAKKCSNGELGKNDLVLSYMLRHTSTLPSSWVVDPTSLSTLTYNFILGFGLILHICSVIMALTVDKSNTTHYILTFS